MKQNEPRHASSYGFVIYISCGILVFVSFLLAPCNYCLTCSFSIMLTNAISFLRYYELNSGCTSILAEDAHGNILHGRNLDYGIKGLQNITIDVSRIEMNLPREHCVDTLEGRQHSMKWRIQRTDRGKYIKSERKRIRQKV